MDDVVPAGRPVAVSTGSGADVDLDLFVGPKLADFGLANSALLVGDGTAVVFAQNKLAGFRRRHDADNQFVADGAIVAEASQVHRLLVDVHVGHDRPGAQEER